MIISGMTSRLGLPCLLPSRKQQLNALMTLRVPKKLGKKRRRANRIEKTDLGGMQSMSMVIIQPFTNCKRVVKYHLTYLVFYIASKPLSIRE